MAKFMAVTCFFNPCGFKAPLRNYHAFASQLRRQGVQLLTVECAFGDKDYEIPESDVRVRSGSVMWQKERLLNHGMNFLPDDCERLAFLDCDIIFSCDDWHEKTMQALDECDVAQVFQSVGHLAKGESRWDGDVVEDRHPGIAWQKVTSPNWLWQRKRNRLPWAHPGFGWAFRREFIQGLGLYDRSVVGGGDTILADCLLDSFFIHDFTQKYTRVMVDDVMRYCRELRSRGPRVGYVPVEIGHLYHGSLDRRNYTARFQMYDLFGFDPDLDIVIKDGVYEWGTPKSRMHEFTRAYFMCREEDL